MLESSTYRKIIDEGRAEGLAEGRIEGRVEGRTEARAEALCKLVRHRLGRLPRGFEARLRSMGAGELDALFDRVLAAADARAMRSLLASLVPGR